MEIECVLLLSAHCKCVVPFYESTLSRPKWSAKSALSLASHKRKAQSSFIQLGKNSDQQFSTKYLMVRTI